MYKAFTNHKEISVHVTDSRFFLLLLMGRKDFPGLLLRGYYPGHYMNVSHYMST